MSVKSAAYEQIFTLTWNWEALKCNYGTCQEMLHYLELSSDNAECADVFLLSEMPPMSNNQNPNPDHSRLVFMTMLSTYRGCQFHSRLYQCLSNSSLI